MKRKIVYTALFLTCVIPLFSWAYSGIPLILQWDWIMEFAPSEVDNLPLLIHVFSASAYYTLAAVQMLPGVRRNNPGWHRRAGRIAITAGIASAISSTWITVIHHDVQGPILFYGRVVFGPLWAYCLTMGLIAARREMYREHREWMIRAFSIAMPASTLVIMILPFHLFLDQVPEILEDSVQSGAWVLHLGIAEYFIRKTRSTNHNGVKKRTSNAIESNTTGIHDTGSLANGVRVTKL